MIDYRDGKWIDPANRCSKCQSPMPLPANQGKCCENCGTRCVVGTMPRTSERRNEKICEHCQTKGAGPYCRKCGRPLQ